MDKELYSQIAWDIVAFNLAMMLATIGKLTYIFMVASVILLVIVLKDISTYYKTKDSDKQKFAVLVLLTLLSTASLILLILCVADKQLNATYVLTYSLYGVSSLALVVALLIAIKDTIKQKKQKEQETSKKEDTIDFVIEELGTSKDREQQNKEETTTNLEDNNQNDN